MLFKKRSTKIVTFMTPGAGVPVLGRGYINYIAKMLYFFEKSSCLHSDIEQTK